MRRRLYAVALKKESLLWVGDSTPDVTQGFMRLLRRSVSLQGDAFVGLDSNEAIVATRADMARKRGAFGEVGQIPFMSLFTHQTQTRISAVATQRARL